jgi:hypothetical protein
MQFVDGENVGPYRIITQLGQGGMATVFKAYHPALDRYVAIKVLHPAFMEDPGFLARFQREAKVVASLDHPNIVPIYDFAEHRGSPYLVMKFIEGETLKARMMSGPLSKAEGLRIIERVGAGLAYAHNKGILHRDIKPSNVLLAPDGGVYLADFGLARIAEAGESTLSSDTMLGTPQYISPEQARGEKNLDAGTDIYSFGVVLYELVVGRVPFSADTPFSIIHDHIYKPLPRPRAINPTVPESVERVLFKALAKSRKDRYAKVEDLVAAFRDAVGGAPASTMPDLGVAGASTRVAGQAQESRTPPVAPSPAPDILPTLAEPSPADSGAAVLAPVRRRPWLWVVAGLAITCICLSSFLLLTRPDRGVSPPSSAAGPAATQVANQGESMPSVADAEAAVQTRPDDPGSHMQLAEVMMAHGESTAAAEQFIAAARILRDTGDYPLAGESTVLALKAINGPVGADPAVLNMIAEFIFVGADRPEMRPVAEQVGRTYPDWDVPPAAAARTFLFTEQPQQALTWANKVLNERPDDPLAKSVRAEFYLLQGNNERASADARQVLSRGGIPGWLFEHLDGLIKRAGNP